MTNFLHLAESFKDLSTFVVCIRVSFYCQKNILFYLSIHSSLWHLGYFVYSFILLLLTVLLWTSNYFSGTHARVSQGYILGVDSLWKYHKEGRCSTIQEKASAFKCFNNLHSYQQSRMQWIPHLCYYFAMGRILVFEQVAILCLCILLYFVCVFCSTYHFIFLSSQTIALLLIHCLITRF